MNNRMNNNSVTYNLPSDMCKLLETIQPLEICKNLSLLLDKYSPQAVFERSKENKGAKSKWLHDVISHSYIDADLSKAAFNRWNRMISSIESIQRFNAKTDWRMVIGLGGETVLETDITLHHLYGIPFIPGSALKGLARAYVTGEIYPSTDINKDNEIVKRIFGTQKGVGTVIFFDAMPVDGQATFALDIMNPHYPDYYGGSKPPTNDQSPIPVTFLTVTDTAYVFALAPRNPKNDQHKADVVQAREWLQESLQKYGVGGKTSAGYGYFKVGQTYTRPDNLPQFHRGDTIRGTVLDEKIDKGAARYTSSGQASKCLQYLLFPTDQVLILISGEFEEAKKWKTRNTSICQFIEEQMEDNRTLLICEPKKKK